MSDTNACFRENVAHTIFWRVARRKQPRPDHDDA
jgi:hypothetical protein